MFKKLQLHLQTRGLQASTMCELKFFLIKYRKYKFFSFAYKISF